MTTAIRRSDPGRPLTIGIHMEDLEEDRQIGPAEAARWCEIVSIHGYPIYADWSAGATDHELLPFLAEITRWLAGGAPFSSDRRFHLARLYRRFRRLGSGGV